jgi:hypothetical protein
MLKTLYALKKGTYPDGRPLSEFKNQDKVSLADFKEALSFGEKNFIKAERVLEFLTAIEKERTNVTFVSLTHKGEEIVEYCIKNGHRYFI